MIALLTTAELGIVATVIVAVAGFYFNSVNAKRDREARIAQAKLDREHAERLAFSERTFRARAEAYADAARLLRIQQLIVFRTDAYSFPDNEADEAHLPKPPVISEDEWARIMGRVAVQSSPETLAALEDVRQRMNSLMLALTVLRGGRGFARREQQEIESGHLDRGPDYDPWSTPDLVKRQEHVLDRRHEAYAAIENAEAVMRAELLEV